MPRVVITYHSDDTGWRKLENSLGVQAFVRLTGEELISTAKSYFHSRSQGEAEAPVFYTQSFGVKGISKIDHLGKLRGVKVFNDDRTAQWVEFGAHAGGETRILKYRVFGVAMDILNARTRGS